MRLWPLVLALCAIIAALFPASQDEKPVSILITGDLLGNLSPCGCTNPMSGGIRRMATAVKAISSVTGTVLLVNDGMVGGTGRQQEIKLDALAEAFRAMDATAINLGPAEAKLGRGAVLSAQQLSDDRFIDTALEESASNTTVPYALKGPFMIGGISSAADLVARTLGEKAKRVDAAAAWLVSEATNSDLVPILMLQAGHDEALRIARVEPKLRLIVYSSSGNPQMERVGDTTLVSPGDNGKYLVRLSYKDGSFFAFTPVQLGPDFKDDPDVSRIYTRYLARIGDERLFEKMPRIKTAAFAGTARCGGCHKAAMNSWLKSDHSHALRTLEREGHSIDPDCMACHVVRPESIFGFRSRKATASLADVGCESCHGPGGAHAGKPAVFKMPKVGVSDCLKCHTANTSPGFAFKPLWKKIAH